MSTVVQSHDTGTPTWPRHVLGAGLGAAVAAALVGLQSWEGHLRDALVRDPSAEPIWILVGLFVLAGATTLIGVLVSRRMPWLPTTAAVVLGYWMLASLPGGWTAGLPYPDSVPRVRWGFTTVALMVGLMSATAVWSWWSYLRRPA